MKIGMTLTLDGLIRALRWQGLTMAETKTVPTQRDGVEHTGKTGPLEFGPGKTTRFGNGL